MQERLSQLAEMDVGKTEFNVDLRKCCTLRIGGRGSLLVEPETVQELQTVLSGVRQLRLPLFILGRGSNIIFSDEGLKGVLIRLGKGFSQISITGSLVCAGARCWDPCLARSVGEAGLSGLEHIVGIPGFLGGLIAMNGGSQRKNIGDSTKSVRVMDFAGNIRTFNANECDFSYRHSIFDDKKDFIIIGAELQLNFGDSKLILKEMLEILSTRRMKFPLDFPNCGSVFKSEPRQYGTAGPPGKIIEECGLKGTSVGDLEVSTKHANFIVNLGKGTASDAIKLIRMVADKVSNKTGMNLIPEIRYVDPMGCTWNPLEVVI